MIYGVSGPAGAGKSTMLQAMKQLADPYLVIDDYKVSRDVQARMGFESLADATATYDKMVNFQRMVYLLKFDHEQRLKERHYGQVMFTERTFADIYAYTHYWISGFMTRGEVDMQEAEDFLAAYLEQCRTAQERCYSVQLLLPMMPHVVFEDDRRRAPREANDATWDMIQAFTAASTVPTHHISGITVDERVADVLSYLKR